jgi:hypothetical protein
MRRVSRLSRVSGDVYCDCASQYRQGQKQRLAAEEVAPTGALADDRAGLGRVPAATPEATVVSLARDEHGYTTAAEATLVGAVTLMCVLSALMFFGQAVRTAGSQLAAQLRSEQSRILTQRTVQQEAESSICGRPDG